MTEQKKKTLSVTKRYIINILNGIFWLLFSIFNLTSIKPLRIISAAFLFLAIICTFIGTFKKQEPDDEMSLEHIMTAKTITLEIMLCLIMIIGVFFDFIPFGKVYGFLVAGIQILPGLLFLKYEKEGY